MDVNVTEQNKENVTLNDVIDYFNLNISSLNKSEVTQIHLFDLYEAYRTIEKEQLMVYKSVAYIIGTLIILSNLTVVISSGLILRKGQQQKSTYLLLGNVSLADTIIGFGLIFGVTVDNSVSSNPLCIFQIGMLVCPAMVSIFSVGLIAVDRYIYILHGLYYQRWFNTTRVRIGILIIWMIGITLGFMPATGWINTELILTRCYYVALFPGALILFNSFLSIIPIVVVVILYSIILVRALRTVKILNASANHIKIESELASDTKMRITHSTETNSTTSTQSVIYRHTPLPKLIRSASFNVTCKKDNTFQSMSSIKSKSIEDMVNDKTDTTQSNNKIIYNVNRSSLCSKISICTVESNICDRNHTISELNKCKFCNYIKKNSNKNKNNKKEPNKWRAITIVMLTSGSFIFTWMPFFIAVTCFVLCEEKITNPKCLYIRHLLGGPLAVLAFVNSILNPLIYAWWHKGFQESVRAYYGKHLKKSIFCSN